MHRVLLATDGSEAALRGAQYLAQLAGAVQGIEVKVLHVIDPVHSLVVPEWLNPKEIEAQVEEHARGVLKRTLDVFREAGLEVEGEIQKGKAGEVIATTAKREGFNEIVMGASGISRLRGVTLGSVTQQVLHLAECPVTIVK
ncbi:MAG: universal stress protein [Bacillota bacterium]